MIQEEGLCSLTIVCQGTVIQHIVCKPLDFHFNGPDLKKKLSCSAIFSRGTSDISRLFFRGMVKWRNILNNFRWYYTRNDQFQYKRKLNPFSGHKHRPKKTEEGTGNLKAINNDIWLSILLACYTTIYTYSGSCYCYI